MSSILAIARFNVKILLKNRATNLFIIISLASILISLSLSHTNIASRFKLFEDILLTTQGYIFLFCAIFYSFELVLKEKIEGLFALPLSAGASRGAYLAASFLSIFFIIFIMFFIFLTLDSLFLFFIEGEIPWGILYQLYLFALSAALVGFFIALFTQYVSVLNGVIYGVVLYLIGNGLDEMHLLFSEHLFSKLLYFTFPNFSFFDFQSFVVNRISLEITDYFFPTLYFLGLSLIIFALSLHKYKKKILDVGN